jgi:NTE family protein
MKRFGLTLGGGGARGGAHIGVLLEMERLGLKPDLITGSSIGGLIAGLLGASLSLDDVTDFLADLRLNQSYSPPRDLISLASHTRLEQMLVATIGRPVFADLRFPVAMVATDLAAGKALVMREGDVVSAILATTAIPGVLPPVQRGGHLLIDGAIFNNTPFDVARALGASDVLAVDLTRVAGYGAPAPVDTVVEATLTERGLGGLISTPMSKVLLSVFDMLLTQSLRAHLAVTPPDLLLQPWLGTIGVLDFFRLQEAIETGRAAFLEQERQIRALFVNRS